MAIRVRCPGCRAVLGLPDSVAGKPSVRCPRCKAAVPVPRQTEAALEEPDEEELAAKKKMLPESESPEDPSASFRYLPIGMLVGVIVLVAVLRLILGPDGFPRPGGSQTAKYVVVGIGLVVGLLLMLTGWDGIKKRHIFGVENANNVGGNVSEWKGDKAVLFGLGQCIAGTILVGCALYGLIF
jgi:LSD1 subclass zinc finger protein